MKVGFIGTGRMGGAMVGRLLAAKHDVGVYNRTLAKAKPLADQGAKIIGSIADAVRYGDVIYTMLADDTALEDVVFRHPRDPSDQEAQGRARRQRPISDLCADDGPAGAGFLGHGRRVRLRSCRRNE
jgi:3-hydroxyisobutyrate dehydrogenase-like beta-hydroxyacid dehydrogenase